MVAVAAPMMGEFFEQEWVHLLLAMFVVPVGLFAFWSGYKHHRQIKVFALGLLGITLVASGLVAPHFLEHLFGHDVITIAGSIVLVTAHVLNRRACLCHRH
ncbi:MerC domain-containing protein [Bdellovibrio bacteriovorus]